MATRILVVDDAHLERVLVERMLCKNSEYQTELAEDGREALDRIDSNPPDLVITDLVMPHLDGLELVRRVRRSHPEIPVILMTAYGDEATAVEALEAGAASYVPKAQRAERLMPAVSRVTRHLMVRRSRDELGPSLLDYHCRFAVDNDRELIRALARHVQQVMLDMGFADRVERIRIGEALEEALLNAMYHGNLEIGAEELARVRAELDERALDDLIQNRRCQAHFAGRRVLVVVRLHQKEARFVIRDEGRGFNTTHAAGASRDRFAAGAARGMTLIRSLMDEVAFNHAGNELVLCKRPGGRSAREPLIAR